MKRKKLVSGLLAASVAVTALAGLTITASAVTDEVHIKLEGADTETMLTATTNSLPEQGISLDAATGTLSFSKNVKLTNAGWRGGYGSCIAAKSSTGVKELTISIPSGVTVTMDNNNVTSWSAAAYGGVTGKITVTGGGTLDIAGEGFYAVSPYNAEYIIDGANVIARGKWAVGEPSTNGLITIRNGGSLTARGTDYAFYQMSGKVHADAGVMVLAGESSDSNQETTLEDAIADGKYKWVRIGEVLTPVETPTPVTTEEPSEEPSEDPTEEPSEEVRTSTGIRIGGTDIYEEDPNWTNGDVTAVYDKQNDTLTLSGNGTINGPSYEDGFGFGGAIYAKKTLNIMVAENADITLNAGVGKDGWSCGIYTYAPNAQIIIGGAGKLTVNSSYSDNEHAIAICPYSTSNHNQYDLILKDSAKVTANGSKYGVYTDQTKAGWIQLQNTASLTASGATNAIRVNDFKEGYIYGGARSFVGSINGGAWDVSKVTTATSLSIKPAAFTQETSEAIIGNDDKTGFVTLVTGNEGVTIKSIKWRITSGDTTKELAPASQPMITLANDAKAIFKVIVNGLSDSGAAAVAVVE